MPFSLFPSVETTEKSISTSIAANATSIGALVGEFAWGPVETISPVFDQKDLENKFQQPTNQNAKDWFTAYNFLAYSNELNIVRQVVEPEWDDTLSPSDWADPSGAVAAYNAGDQGGSFVKNSDHFENNQNRYETEGQSFIAKYPGSYGNDLSISIANSSEFGASPAWGYEDEFDETPEGEEFAMVVLFNGQVVETFLVSKDSTATDYKGNTKYAPTVVNRQSIYVWMVEGNTVGTSPDNLSGDYDLTGGADGDPIGDSERQFGWDLFSNPRDIKIDFAMVGNASQVSAQYVIDNISGARKDCVAYISPQKANVVDVKNAADSIVEDRNNYPSSSYAVFDGNYKYQYDKYNDLYRWVPLNGDIAGLCAYTDSVSQPWFSPAGYTRGRIKNTVKFAFNPTDAQQRKLYTNSVNPVIKEAGEGSILNGDKTMLSKPSAFDRINVRRLFIVLERAISDAAKYQLFEFNDEFTRTNFVNQVRPFLRSVQGRRGIIEYRVIADDSNNTDQVINNNQFVGDIYIKPARSINFIQLNFVAVNQGVEFEEIVTDNS